MYLIKELWLAVRLTAGVVIQGQFWAMLLRQLAAPAMLAVVISMFGFAYLSPFILRDIVAIGMRVAHLPSLPALAGLACLLFMAVAAVPLLARAWCPGVARAVLEQMRIDLPEVTLPGTGRFIGAWLGLIVVIVLLLVASIGTRLLLPQFAQKISYVLMFFMLVAVSSYHVACALCQHASRADIGYVKQTTLVRRAILWSLLIYLLWTLAGLFFAPSEAVYAPFKPFEAANAGYLLLDVASKLLIVAVAMVLWAALSLPVLAARQGALAPAAASREQDPATPQSRRWQLLLVVLAAIGLAYFARFSALHTYLRLTDDRYAMVSAFDELSSQREKLSRHLYQSACDGTPAVKLLVRAGVPGSQDSTGPRLGAELQCAAVHDHPDTVVYLLAQGANPNAYGPLGEQFAGAGTPLYAAVLQRNAPMVELLLRHNAEPSTGAQSGETPLQAAAAQGDLKLFAMLVKAGADIKGASAQTLLHYYLAYVAGQPEHSKARWVAALDEAVAAGMPLKGKDKEGRSALHLAAMMGEFDLIDALLERGLDRLGADFYDGRPFMYLAYWYANRATEIPGPELESTLLVLSYGAPGLNAKVNGKGSYWFGMPPLPPSWSIANAAVAKRRLRKLFDAQLDYSTLTVNDFVSQQALGTEGAAEDLLADLNADQLRAASALPMALERRGWPELARQAVAR